MKEGDRGQPSEEVAPAEADFRKETKNSAKSNTRDTVMRTLKEICLYRETGREKLDPDLV